MQANSRWEWPILTSVPGWDASPIMPHQNIRPPQEDSTMTTVHRHIALFLAAIAVAFSSYTSVRAQDAAAPGRAQLEQAAQSVAEGAKESIATARNDSEAIKRAQTALSIIYTIGDLGGFSTAKQADKLMADLRNNSRPAVADALAQMQF